MSAVSGYQVFWVVSDIMAKIGCLFYFCYPVKKLKSEAQTRSKVIDLSLSFDPRGESRTKIL